jgi:3-phosphoshikimate 1-carboxyvinyltransferase
MQAIVYPARIQGSQIAPASKSSMQRACAAALLHGGVTTILNPGHSNDDLAALDVIQNLGATIEKTSDSIVVRSNDVNAISGAMNCGESGLGIRMFTPIASMSANTIHISGKGSLVKRPMHFFDEILPQLKVSIVSNNGFLPFEVKGPLQPSNITVDGSLSSQFLTGLLMAYAASRAEGNTITVTNLKSKPYIDLTLDVLQKFGWEVTHQNHEVFEFKNRVSPKKEISYTVEGDWSGAAFLLVAGAIAGPIVVKGLQLHSTQADKAVMQALTSTGVNIVVAEDAITIGNDDSNQILTPFEFDATDCPDLFPPLVALASACKGESKIKGVSRLAHKESDRGLTLQTEFKKLGIEIVLEGDMMIVKGGTGVQSNTVFSQHDHRIAMACGVAALIANGPIVITEAEAINKSYTDFFEHLQHLGAKVDIN